eukprot:TRINITY_DN3784_c0_g1_i14.p1 TRINITY_DN3784_c0_g1~~TRINITY_DN3784_c0_g1_i14.p1  ORF type:complete len:175 (-),score=38.47 TRINITY_DN3784_c0_g1_i14:233-757(-)
MLDSPVNDMNTIESLTRALRQIFSEANYEQTLRKFAHTELSRKLLRLLDVSSESVRINVGWILSNFAAVSSDSTSEFLSLGVHRKLLDITREGSEELKEQSLWFMANLMGDSAELRDELLQTDLVAQLAEILGKGAVSTGMLEVVCWVIAGLSKLPPPPCEKVLSPSSIDGKTI